MSKFKTFEWKTIHGSGDQYLKFFPNGYGVSIVKHRFSYGGENGNWEIAVLIGSKSDWEICYDTHITNDVIGHVPEDEVDEIVANIEALEGKSHD